MKKYFIATYGCQMNVHESEKLAGILRNADYAECNNESDADIIAINTCCVREKAETKVIGYLGHLKALKQVKKDLIIAVCGCMTQQEGTADSLKKKFPFIDILFGTHNTHLFSEYLDERNEGKGVIAVQKDEGEIHEDTPVHRTSGLNAWVNIMYGCDNYCSFCIVPYVRGRERSRAVRNILNEVKGLIEEGYKEITLLGQNVNSYKCPDTQIDFADLIEKIAKIDGKFRVRFTTSHPKDFSEKVVLTMRDNPKITKYIHLPIQAGSDKILELMNRGYTQKDYLNKIDFIKKHLPSVGLSTDIMVGFPQETEKDFLETLKVAEQVKFNNVFSFIFSIRSGTKAATMDGQIEKETKKDRIARFNKLQFDIGVNLAKECVGQKFEVLAEEFKHFEGKPSVIKSRTDCNKIVTFECDKDLTGQFANVIIKKNKNSNLFGEVFKEE
ncbi:MAG: tRNA (N6-isopentenyl adenosine(37)-C2)-methylthiotransferase MiaB [Firmicutes bacterium]|nr:tRNA (N6-isopentenyl adenosine(37)-C2)-methylthiotransferase MiaB [Bacillota bacterium]